MVSIQPERQYVLDQGQALGLGIKLVAHPFATSTCAEKVDLLQRTHPETPWGLDRAVKALYGKIDEETYGFVLPELGTATRNKIVDAPAIRKLFEELELSPPLNSRLYLEHSPIPGGMELGTCTPFISPTELGKIKMLFIHDAPHLDSKIVDVSIGGQGEQYHRASLHLPYRAIYAILERQYGSEKIKKVSFF